MEIRTVQYSKADDNYDSTPNENTELEQLLTELLELRNSRMQRFWWYLEHAILDSIILSVCIKRYDHKQDTWI